MEDSFASDTYSYAMFQSDSREQQHYTKERTFFNSVLKRELREEKEHLELMLLKNEQLSRSLSAYFFRDASESKRHDAGHDVPALKDFTLIHIVLTNNYRVLKDNLLNGMTYQALVLFRNTIELTELAICLLGDERVHGFYRKDIENGLFQSIKFGTLKIKTVAIMKWVKALPNNNFPQELWAEYLTIRQQLYEDSSKHTHSNFGSIVTNAFVTPIPSAKLEDDGDFMMPNLGGIISVQSKPKIKEILLYEYFSYLVLIILLIEKHKLPFKHFGEKSSYTTALTKVGMDLVVEYLHRSYSP